ncbi:MAG: HEPN domain-containing protein [Planctomycetota bacterium]
MTPHEATKRKVLAEWLHKADDDLGLAKHLVDQSLLYPNAIVFHSQQAAEKCIKALLVWREIPFPKTHDFKVLLELIRPTDATLAESLRDVVVLTSYGVEPRYPGDHPDATPQEAQEAVALALKVRKAVYDVLPSP